MLVNQTAGDPNSQVGPFFGSFSYDDHVNINNPLALSGLGIEATFGKVYYSVPDPNFTLGDFQPTGVVATFNQWHHFRILLDYSSSSYKAFFDNTLLVTSSFVDAASGVSEFTATDMQATVAGNAAIDPSLTGTAYFDNFVVREDTLLMGDYDQNGIVNTADYSLWKQAFGTTVAAGSGADGNGNGKVDAADYTVWRDHLGTSLFSASGSGSLSAQTVPEPSTLVLLLCGFFATACRGVWRVRAKL